MNYLGKVLNNCKTIYNEINGATLTGAIDVVVVEQPDGTYTCSPFHVRFGKIGVLRSREKVVDIEINGEPVDIHMKLGESGEAFFVEGVAEDEDEESIPPHLATSPIPPDSSSELWQRLENQDGSPTNSDILCSNPPLKTFKAEQLNQEVNRKLSSTEFRPISINQDSASETSNLDFNKDDSLSGDEVGSQVSSKQRRRRKRSTKKRQTTVVAKRNSTAGLMGENSSEGGAEGFDLPQSRTDDLGGEAIFLMDDLDNPNQPIQSQNSSNDEDHQDQEPPVMQKLPVDRELHFFSDTEITPGSSPREELAPVQSDSELESKRLMGGGGGSCQEPSVLAGGLPTLNDEGQSWKWGELPTSIGPPPTTPQENKQESQRWMVSMLGFMKRTKHIRHKTEAEGVYLSELNYEDPEVAALYFSNYHQHPSTDFVGGAREEDAESGNGPSLPQSPHSVEGAICGPKSTDSSQKWYPEDIALSLCGTPDSPECFQEHLITFDDLVNDPTVLTNPKLVARIDGKLYSWKAAIPAITSLLVFRRPLPTETVLRLCDDHESMDASTKQQKKTYSSWFSWSRSGQANNELTSNDKTDKEESPLDLTVNKAIEDGVEEVKEADEGEKEAIAPSEEEKAVEAQESGPSTSLALDLKEPIESEAPRPGTPDDLAPDSAASTPCNNEKYRKTLRLSSHQIAKLNLKSGANEVEFSVTTAYQGTSRCKCFLFCWRYDDKIVVSDIDGTITKSDVLGHILPIVGKDWAQSGVAKLFSKIEENGYKLLYLSARAIGQSRVTREYLKSIRQGDVSLPEGPVLLNPTSLLNAFHTEVIERKPEEFKISCLRDIQALFPSNIKPFYAGYGNKINDVWAYQAVGIPIFRIFTINHRGELKHELTQTFQSTYLNMSNLVDQMFPASKSNSAEDYTEFSYWREPIMDVQQLPPPV